VVNACCRPPGLFVADLVDIAVVHAAKRDRELIAQARSRA